MRLERQANRTMNISRPHSTREVLRSMLSSPTNGVTTAPKIYPVTPKMAEALPASARPSFIAKELLIVKINPKQNNIRQFNTSYRIKLSIMHKAKYCIPITGISPHAPYTPARLRSLNLRADIEPATTNRALPPMNRPKITSLNP